MKKKEVNINELVESVRNLTAEDRAKLIQSLGSLSSERSPRDQRMLFLRTGGRLRQPSQEEIDRLGVENEKNIRSGINVENDFDSMSIDRLLGHLATASAALAFLLWAWPENCYQFGGWYCSDWFLPSRLNIFAPLFALAVILLIARAGNRR